MTITISEPLQQALGIVARELRGYSDEWQTLAELVLMYEPSGRPALPAVPVRYAAGPGVALPLGTEAAGKLARAVAGTD